MRRSAWIAVSAGAAYALLSVLVTVEWGPLRQLDDTVARWADRTATGHPTWVDAMIVWTDTCGPWTWRLLAMALALGLAVRGLRQPAAFAIIATVGGGLVSTGMKVGVSRERPVVDSPYTTAAGQSFPSGHASAVAIGCGVALLAVAWGRRHRVVAVVAVVIVLVTAYTRVGLVVHWPSDVVGGLLLGVAVVAAAYTLTARQPGRARPYPGAGDSPRPRTSSANDRTPRLHRRGSGSATGVHQLPDRGRVGDGVPAVRAADPAVRAGHRVPRQ